eukprot:4402472-Lingulodinium_polyedra.AAC.1
MYIVVASVRNSFGLLTEHLSSWLQSKLVFLPDAEFPPAEDRAELWRALAVEPELVEILAYDLHLQWQEGQLQVVASSLVSGDILHKVSGALLGLWEFKQFTTSRWVTVGTSCRSLAAALVTGFDSLVTTVREDPKASDFHIHGYERLSLLGKQFVFVAAMASYIPEA